MLLMNDFPVLLFIFYKIGSLDFYVKPHKSYWLELYNHWQIKP